MRWPWSDPGYGPSVGAHPGRSREPCGDARSRGMVVTSQEEQNPAYRPTGVFVFEVLRVHVNCRALTVVDSSGGGGSLRAVTIVRLAGGENGGGVGWAVWLLRNWARAPYSCLPGCGAEKVRGLSTGMRRLIVLASGVACAGLLALSAMSSGDGMGVVATALAGFFGGSMIGWVIAFVSNLFAGSRWIRSKREGW
jgi:hypothetical protein